MKLWMFYISLYEFKIKYKTEEEKWRWRMDIHSMVFRRVSRVFIDIGRRKLGQRIYASSKRRWLCKKRDEKAKAIYLHECSHHIVKTKKLYTN